MKHLEVQEVFSVDTYSIIKAKYGDKNYYVAGVHDITDYVNSIVHHQDLQTVNKNTLELGLQLYFSHNPKKNILNVPLFDLVLLDDKNTSAQYVVEMCMDLFHYSEERAMQVVNALNSPAHTYKVGSFTEEMCITYCVMFENGNQSLNQNLGFDFYPVVNKPQSYEAALETLENLIRRDYPEDI